MQKFFVILGDIFKGLDVFLSIVCHTIWIVIGGALLLGILYVASVGPNKIIQNIVPSSLLSAQSSSSSQNSNQNNSNNNNNSNGKVSLTAGQMQCAVGAVGVTRINQLMTGSQPTSTDMTKLTKCGINI